LVLAKDKVTNVFSIRPVNTGALCVHTMHISPRLKHTATAIGYLLPRSEHSRQHQIRETSTSLWS